MKSKAELESTFPQLTHTANIYAKCYLINKLLNCDLILEKIKLTDIKIIFNFKNKTITW